MSVVVDFSSIDTSQFANLCDLCRYMMQRIDSTIHSLIECPDKLIPYEELGPGGHRSDPTKVIASLTRLRDHYLKCLVKAEEDGLGMDSEMVIEVFGQPDNGLCRVRYPQIWHR